MTFNLIIMVIVLNLNYYNINTKLFIKKSNLFDELNLVLFVNLVFNCQLTNKFCPILPLTLT